MARKKRELEFWEDGYIETEEFEHIGRKYFHCGKRVTKKEYDRLLKISKDEAYSLELLRGEFGD